MHFLKAQQNIQILFIAMSNTISSHQKGQNFPREIHNKSSIKMEMRRVNKIWEDIKRQSYVIYYVDLDSAKVLL